MKHYAAALFVLFLLPTDRGRLLVWVDGVEPGVAPYRNLPDTDFGGYLHSLDYARNRPQGRVDGSGKGADGPQVRIVEHADVRRMLLAQKAYAEGALALALLCARLVDEKRTGSSDEAHVAGCLLELLTPIAKSWPSEWCLEANSLAIQVHGGYGYTREYPVEQYYRDNRLNPIHEGTHGIQGLDLLGRKVRMKDGAALKLLAARMLASAEAARRDPALAAYLRGEGFRSAGEAGWVLLCVDGYPLGWGKRVAGSMKSHYPRGLRWV